MSQISNLDEEKTQDLDFSEIELAVRRWAAQTGHDNDQEFYKNLKEQHE